MEELRRWAIGLLFLGAAGAAGCDAGETSTGGGAGSAPCPDDPAEGAVKEECGIWVSAGRGDDANAGTQGAPVATLAHAIELAEKGSGKVYACSEAWTESLTVPGGVSLHGGFDCEDGWAYVGAAKRSMLTPPSTTAMTWVDSGSTADAWLTDFYVEAISATEPGGSSVALFIRDELRLTVKRCELVAGDGADGLDGAPGDADGLPAAAGVPGNEGEDACSAPLTKGGAAPENACEQGTSRGGKGGDSSTAIAESGGTGEPIGAPPGGTGGLGEALSPNCIAGVNGNPGEEGAIGFGGGTVIEEGDGRLTVEGIVSYSGRDGGTGGPGQGGGGGGATFGSAAVCGGASSGGAAGGSGGTGGCGGKGGKGGQGGGWSAAVAVRSSKAGLYDNIYRSGNAGDGGDGGAPQEGGPGGAGAGGGKGSGSISLGCAGGIGGPGGKGGIGGGGAGGWSVGIVFLYPEGVPSFEGGDYSYGEPGKGGLAGPKTNNPGRDGDYQQVKDLRHE